MMVRAVRVILILFLVVLLLPSTTLTEGVVITSCSHCTMNRSERWCPDDMTCWPAKKCICGTKCLGITDCFAQETTCARCVSGGGTFCTHPVKGYRPCFFTIVSAGGHAPTASQDDQCREVCLEKGRCLSHLTECPKEHVDPISLSWFLINVAFAVAIAVFVGIVVYVGVKRAKLSVTVSQHDHLYGAQVPPPQAQ
ncbi:hypothetical protein TCDM_14362 [Trypanosoma cruzi Dm28c]|uniref:Uncharacterized protein n=2 Tax=Trypanosoma cruzi TaxID=5693 RepID=V5AQE0_TRYCR|nr:hypothetical protein TCDM_14362 [Trypanosoma cruzi Dm28c]KAF8282938.1 hypothetical protein TcBrA4_0079820 [Trypanosoma cruzi]PBJ70862.1 hypothetical protein BCY84_17880 [Trypanosoma cruzi cruzi]PWV00562.1 hypothetical protein C4B63_6g569 [Trypanosoma cruzi]